ncbi:nucleotide sugar dehydrogenase [Thermovibrio ammonificans HB-1]|uniref:Nucleotide sugar dehydrogenase n=1 Tax=Thermovibrio ammonificans (strain DSM 15698 / JCM 12110 / HB-1) TaxID=648996 RepID=E8T5Y9_THEA1|nr:nucleotide sugar dehydrogenase [Thermovibrio ammonificans]ADU96573.1 nucleotide sugar dehydrogenase [Thermovibrio ammonificans HB-1]
MVEFPTFEDFLSGREKVAVVGLGYVGLPLAVLLGRKFKVVGFDVNPERVAQLKAGIDKTGEVSREAIEEASVEFTTEPEELSGCRLIIVTVPTPVDRHNIPDLRPVKLATKTVGRHMVPGTVVVYESTVYPGLTEEVCVPLLEKESGLKYMEEFKVGYSPERVNPGDKKHTIEKIVKVVAGCDDETADLLEKVYGSVIEAGVYRAPNIKTAEAAKVIENTQRDLNIALMNELALIFHRMGIDTRDVIEAAATKWNFLKFEPGLVGGHCIGVDPYYLTFKAQELGYHPEVILAGRRINDYMGKFVAEQTVKQMIKAGKQVLNAKVLVMGVTFKENVKDVRNSKVIDIYNELNSYGVKAFLYDPVADGEEFKREYGVELIESVEAEAPYDAVVVAVKHDSFKELPPEFFRSILGEPPILIDVKGIYNRERFKDFLLWRL